MKLKFSLFIALVAFITTACSNDDSDSWLQGETKNYSINSNIHNQELPQFKALDTWTATVGYGTASTGWVTLDAEQGAAGTHKLTAHIEANNTSNRRSATVTVTCHGETLKYQFSQEGRTGGDTPTPSSSAKMSKIVMTSYDTSMNQVYEESISFTYNGNTIASAAYHSYDKLSLTETDIQIAVDRTTAGKRTMTLSQSGMPDEVITAELDASNRFTAVGDYKVVYNGAGYVASLMQGEHTWLYDTDTKSCLIKITGESTTTIQFNPDITLRQDCNFDVNRLVKMTMTERGLLKYALLMEAGNFGTQMPAVLYKSVTGRETYNFNPQLDSSKTLLSVDLYHHYDDMSPVIQKRYTFTYTD